MIRQLDPSKVPASCEQCKPTELSEENYGVWKILDRFPGVIERHMAFAGKQTVAWHTVNYTAAIWIGDRMDCPLGLIEALEAIVKGLNS